MPTYYKTTDLDGASRRDLTWTVGETVRHPTSSTITRSQPWTYLSLALTETDALFGGAIPCRLFRVEPVGEMVKPQWPSSARAVLAAKVVEELEPWRALGSNGRQVAAFLARIADLTDGEMAALSEPATAESADAWGSAGEATGGTARYGAKRAVWNAVNAAVPGPARLALRNAGTALVVADLLTGEQYQALTAPVVEALGGPDGWPVPDWCTKKTGDRNG